MLRRDSESELVLSQLYFYQGKEKGKPQSGTNLSELLYFSAAQFVHHRPLEKKTGLYSNISGWKSYKLRFDTSRFCVVFFSMLHISNSAFIVNQYTLSPTKTSTIKIIILLSKCEPSMLMSVVK